MTLRNQALPFTLLTVFLSAALLGCPLLKKKGGAEADEAGAEVEPEPPADAATVTVAGTGAKNEADILRYAIETPLDNVPAVIGSEGAKARNFPGNGPEVAFLPKGTPVAKIAQYFSTGVLVMFDDPSGDGSKLMGWVTPKAFDVEAPPPQNPVVVPPRAVDAGPRPTPTAPPPTVVDAGAPRDAGAPQDAGGAPRDAGTPPRDAGGGAVVVADAGGAANAIPTPPRGVPAVQPTNGKCPTSWALTEGMCRRTCTTDTDCVNAGLRGVKCAAKGPAKVCTSDH